MLSYLKIVIVALLAGALSAVLVYRFAPLTWLENGPAEPRFGTTVTTIAGTDTLSNSRTTINNNFTALNNGKIENSSTSIAAITTLSNLATVGTITSGTWSGSTIAIAKGGTNATSFTTTNAFVGFNGTSLITAPLTSALTFTYASTTVLSASGNLYANSKLVPGFLYPSFTASSTAPFVGTTTVQLGIATLAETWASVQCYTDAGTLNVQFYSGTNKLNMFNASTTIGTVTLSTNNTFAANTKRSVDVGTPASSPNYISCTIKKSFDP